MDKTARVQAARPSRGRKNRGTLSPAETRRLIQLAVCLGLFLVLFIGRGIFPERMQTLGVNIRAAIGESTDFRGAFADFGRSIQEGTPVFGAVNDLWQQVFGLRETAPPPEAGLPEYLATPAPESGPDSASEPPAEPTPAAEMDMEPPEVLEQEETETVIAEAEALPETEVLPEEPPAEPSPVPSSASAGGESGGKTVPEKVNLERVDLGLAETVTPVMGVISSGYGFRDHPIDGEYTFHYGVDIFGEKGTPVLALADGVVDYIGESPVYGLYIQIRHDNGVTSFYAHCDELLLGKGKTVKAGQAIAALGETGNVTGPHLHLEIRKDERFCNPLYYIESR